MNQSINFLANIQFVYFIECTTHTQMWVYSIRLANCTHIHSHNPHNQGSLNMCWNDFILYHFANKMKNRNSNQNLAKMIVELLDACVARELSFFWERNINLKTIASMKYIYCIYCIHWQAKVKLSTAYCGNNFVSCDE